MKKKMVKVCTLALSGLMVISSVSPVFAYDLDVNGNSIENVEYQNTEDENYTNATNVFAELGSEYKVTIPKTIVLSGVDKKANYYVKVEGDIAGYETVNVIPDETVSLYTKNKDVQTGTITQDKTAWKFDDFDVNANGQVTANNLTAGKWSGTFNFTINLEKVAGDIDEPVILPTPGTALADMSFKDIQNVAKAGKTEDYNIKVGDIIKVNDNIDAEIINIGNDYIEFVTIQKVVDGAVQVAETNVDGVNLSGWNSSFYTVPQVNNGITNTSQISYVGSNIQSEVNAWLDSQSDEFKSSLQSVEREYEVATLTFDDNKYSEAITSTIKDTEKIYIPTKAELENIYTISDNHKKYCFWTATPYAFSSSYNNSSFSLGFFYYGNMGYSHNNVSGNGYGAIAMFRIG